MSAKPSNEPSVIVIVLLLLLPAYDGVDRSYLKAIYAKDWHILTTKIVNFRLTDVFDAMADLLNGNVDSKEASNEGANSKGDTSALDTRADSDLAVSSRTSGSDKDAARIANNEITLARTSCGLSALSADPELEKIAVQHANYINHVFANATPTVYDAHSQSKIDDIAEVTGASNPFFTGIELKDRMQDADYSNVAYGVAENIAQSSYYHSLGDMVAANSAAQSMTKSLLAAPYHLRGLMIPNSSLTGTGVVAYKPYAKDASTYQSYALVSYAAASKASRDISYSGIFTYPCQGVSETVTALYNETPDPFRGARNLQTNPIGQPVYINVPSAKTIKISKVSFYDVARNIEVPTQLLDVDQDPYKHTIYQLPANEAFILPMTDTLKSCEHKLNTNANCGLYSNSQYRVSFEVMIDNKAVINKSFTFTTGEVDY